MARNANRNGKSNTRSAATPKLSQRGCGAVALAVAGLVFLAGAGHTLFAALGAVALYLLVKGGASSVARGIPSARQVLRGIAWCAVAVAVAMASQGPTQAGGATLGLALAAALATYLRTSQRRTRR